MILEFPNKQWKRRTLYYLVRKIEQTSRDIYHLKDVLCRCWDMIIQDLIDSLTLHSAINQ